MMKRLITVCAATMLLVLSGCTPADVIVVDDAGKPIEGATVWGASLSMNGTHNTTDKNGCANIPTSVQQTKWISVTKDGFAPSSNIDVDQATRPIKVVLKTK